MPKKIIERDGVFFTEEEVDVAQEIKKIEYLIKACDTEIASLNDVKNEHLENLALLNK